MFSMARMLIIPTTIGCWYVQVCTTTAIALRPTFWVDLESTVMMEKCWAKISSDSTRALNLIGHKSFSSNMIGMNVDRISWYTHKQLVVAAFSIKEEYFRLHDAWTDSLCNISCEIKHMHSNPSLDTVITRFQKILHLSWSSTLNPTTSTQGIIWFKIRDTRGILWYVQVQKTMVQICWPTGWIKWNI